MNKAIVFGIVLLTFVGLGFAIQDASSIETKGEGSYTSGTTATDLTEGGNVTGIVLTGNTSTQKWAGYYGNVTGNLVLGLDSTSIMFAWSWDQADGGEVCVSQDASFDWSSVSTATNSSLNTVWSFGAAKDNATATYTTFENYEIAGAALTNVETATDVQGWETGVVDDGNDGAEVDFAFCVKIDTTGAATALDGHVADYQLMVPTTDTAGHTETYYFFLELQ
ncbi:hypothetical protein KAW38_00885 [Candidatus Micrarchaeota archaeon]|nr:hypothetical protein [Candidatus Micrarchaeota archaeon]